MDITEDFMLGTPPPVKAGATPVVAASGAKGITEEFMLGTKAAAAEEPSYWDAVKERASGAVGALEFVAAPLQMIGGAISAGLGAINEMIKGTPRREALQLGLESGGRVGAMVNPVTVAKQVLGYEPEPTVLDSALTAFMKAVHHYGEKVEVGTNRALLAEDVDMFAQFLLAGFAGRAASWAAKKVGPAESKVPSGKVSVLAKSPGEIRSGKLEPEPGVEAARMSYMEAPKGEPSVADQPIPTAEAPAYQQTPVPPTAAERAAITKARKADVRAAFKDVDTADYLQFKANESMESRSQALINDAMKTGRTVNAPDWADVAKDAYEISQKPGMLRSPEEMIRLREYNRRAFADQAGKVDPEMLPFVLAALSVGTAGGLAVYRYLKGLQDSSAAEEQKQKNLEWETEHPKPFGTKPGGAPEQPDDWTLLAGGGALAAAGVIKPRGGNWDFRTVKDLARPLAERLYIPPEHSASIGERAAVMQADTAARGQATRMVSSYLNKHAGTATDPIKDLRLPNGDKWGNLTDRAFSPTSMKYYREHLSPEERAKVQNVSGEESVWGTAESGSLSSSPGTGINRIKSYLSHAGDYARANIPPEKLAQYDLPRLIRETVANDNHIAAEALRDFTKPNPVRIGDTQAMPEYKGYAPVEQGPRKFSFNKDGSIRTMEEIQLPKGEVQYSWREIKLQEELTAEQVGRVRRATVKEMRQVSDNGMEMPDNITGDEVAYTALDAKGKPIIDNFSKRPATGATPQKAHLAGQLAQEGNALGHCVGSYVDAVASGESRILSLRDQLGRSYATVELEPGSNGYQGDVLAAVHSAEGIDKSKIVRMPDKIAQIKGPGNGASADYVRPFIQDLLNSKKWEFTDEGHRNIAMHGLKDIRAINQHLHSDTPKFDEAKGRFITREEFLKGPPGERTPLDLSIYERGPGNGQRGSADPKLLAKIAAVGGGAALGAYLDPEHWISGALKGAGVGILATKVSPKGIADLVKRASLGGPLIKIDDMARATVYARGVAKRAVYQLATAVEKSVPDVARREAIFRHLDGDTSIVLSPAEAKVAQNVRAFYDTLGAAAKKAGVIKEVLDNYATRIYGPDSRSIFVTRPVGPNMTLDSPFGKHRAYPTLAEAEAAGLKPTTIDISKVVEAYSDSITNALENRNFISTLKAATMPDGTALIAKEGKAPHDYVFIDHSSLRGLRVHPDIAGDLKFIFDQTSPPAIIRALDAINTAQKRMAVSMSLFHAAALEHAMLGATPLLKSPIRGIKIAAQSFAPWVFGENLAVRMIKEGGAGDAYDLAMKSGLKVGLERMSPALQELSSGFYEMMGKISNSLDETIPGLGKQTVGRFTQLNHMFDRAMWGRFHAAMKLETWTDKVSELSRNNARDVAAGKAQMKPLEDIHRMASSFTNDVFGGLDWHGIVQEFDTRWGRELASAALGPSGRLGMRLLMFAPDWTISTTRAFLKAFGQQGVAAGAGAVLGSQIDPEHSIIGGALGAVLGLGAGRAAGLSPAKGSGIKGLWRPTELADLHRQYLMRSAFIYTAVVDAINVQMSGHHIWDNKDPTRLDRGDGTTQQVSKHFMEPFHWLMTPRQQAMNKLSYVVKEPLAQLQDVDYLSATGAPRMGKTPAGEPITLGTRLEHAARGMNPIAVQQSWDNSATKGLAGFMGAPIYGHTHEERAAAKLEARQRAVQRRIEKRAKELR